VIVLERWTQEELTRVPPGPSAAELRRRVRVRRARRVGLLATAAIVFATLGTAAMLHSPEEQRVRVVQPAPTNTSAGPTPTPATVPLATTEQFPPLARMAEIVSNNVRSDDRPGPGAAHPTSGEIVETTRARAFLLWGGSLENLGEHIYVVQVIGNFTCDHCSRPANAVAPHGRAIVLQFDAAGNGYSYGVGPRVYDLSTLGTVYRFPLAG
jgi:hypothetical protein